ncbi:hypothetical protein K435DRAFT_776179 [Dendrothele bispora CBS 962.96]|uniref:Uncharacterized protein n=1 Tax=Dendrothele bispora (strain CBS 962.96) TaxID=1314807 RepID=A0A4S8MES7_DENBC|nr:hypothetical protein K435DRAFT_776179 [Dendrothele bispora CBS 962.96]
MSAASKSTDDGSITVTEQVHSQFQGEGKEQTPASKFDPLSTFLSNLNPVPQFSKDDQSRFPTTFPDPLPTSFTLPLTNGGPDTESRGPGNNGPPGGGPGVHSITSTIGTIISITTVPSVQPTPDPGQARPGTESVLVTITEASSETRAVASASPTSSANADSANNSSFFSNKSAVIGTFVTAGIVIALLLGFCAYKSSRRNKRRMEKDQDRVNDEIIAEYAANALAAQNEKEETEQNDGRVVGAGGGLGSGTKDLKGRNKENDYALPQESLGYGYGYGGSGNGNGNGEYPRGPTSFGGDYGYPAPGEYAFDLNAPSHRYPTTYPTPVPNMNPMPTTRPPLSGPNGSVPRSNSNPFIQQHPSSPYHNIAPTATAAAAVRNEESLPNPYDGIEAEPEGPLTPPPPPPAPHFLGPDARMNSSVSLASVQSYGSMNQPPMQPEDSYGRNQNAYMAVPSGMAGMAGIGARRV